MKPQLTPAQINIIYAFVEGNGVNYYDLQIELADHLATEIEQQWAENPSFSFEETLSNVYAGFGRMGFRETVQKAHLMMTKKYQKIWWSYFRQFWKLPKILFSFLLLGFIGMCFITFGYKTVMYCHFGLLTVHVCYSMFQIISRTFSKVQLLSFYGMNSKPFEVTVYWLCLFLTFHTTFIASLPLISAFIAVVWLMMWAGYETDIYFLKEQKRLYPQAFA